MATFILQKILIDETGLAYICQTYERFSHVAMVLVSLGHMLSMCTCVLIASKVHYCCIHMVLRLGSMTVAHTPFIVAVSEFLNVLYT